MTNSRNKGATFERDIARILDAELGIKFKRNLEQYQQKGLGDLTPSDDAFPFLIECKAYKAGTDCRPDWERQAREAAQGTGLYPVVIWKFNNHPIKCRVDIAAIAEASGGTFSTHRTADVDMQCFAMIAREIMARRAEGKVPGSRA